MADVTIDNNVYATLYLVSQRAGPFYVSPTVGYVIQVDHSLELQYKKTVDGGANWAAPVQIKSGDTYQLDCYADYQVDGDAGTKIHIFYIHGTTDTVRYVYLDTNGDSVGGDDLIETVGGTGALEGVGRTKCFITGCKTRGGLLRTRFWYNDDAPAYHEGGYSSPDGDTWVSEADVFEGTVDVGLLCPANLADADDTWMLYVDNDAKLSTLKTYDDSEDSWSEVAISTHSGAASYMQTDCQIRLSDGHIIGVFLTLYDNASADIEVWDMASGAIVQKTNVVTDSAEMVQCSVFINQVNDDIYVVYIKGTTWTSEVAVVYQKSTNGGTNWDGETAMQANAEDDERWVSAGCMKASLGGKFQPFWFNVDLKDLFTNTDNGISIAAEVSPGSNVAGITAHMLSQYRRSQ